jgi:atypical dual specificity phosphatase
MMKAEDRAVALNFSWVERGIVAGCRGPRTDVELAWLVELGIRALVRLASKDETGLDVSEVECHGIRDHYEPVADFTPPSQEQLDRVITFMQSAVKRGEPVAVSCGAGKGRIGTVLACYLVAKGCLRTPRSRN